MPAAQTVLQTVSQTPRVLLIGVGNDLRGDDAVGRAVVERLGETLSEVVRVESVTQLLPEHVEWASEADELVLIDAAADRPAATVDWLEIRDGEAQSLEAGSAAALSAVDPHRFDGRALLRMCRDVFGRAPRATLVSIGGSEWGMGRPMSPSVAGVVDAVVVDLARFVRLVTHRHGLTPPARAPTGAVAAGAIS